MAPPISTNVMNVAAVSHFVDDAIEIGVLPDMPPTECSWITAPSAAYDLDHAGRQAGGAHPLLERRVGGVERAGCEHLSGAAADAFDGAFVSGTVVASGAAVDVASSGAGSSFDPVVADDPQPTRSSPNATNATARPRPHVDHPRQAMG